MRPAQLLHQTDPSPRFHSSHSYMNEVTHTHTHAHTRTHTHTHAHTHARTHTQTHTHTRTHTHTHTHTSSNVAMAVSLVCVRVSTSLCALSLSCCRSFRRTSTWEQFWVNSPLTTDNSCSRVSTYTEGILSVNTTS